MSAVIVYPGQDVKLDPSITTRIGQGLVQVQVPVASEGPKPANVNVVLASRSGVLCSDRTGSGMSTWIQNSQKMYVPAIEDLVIGTVIEKHAENYRIDFGSTQPGQLPATAFEGATKRNKPNINVGALVYCRVILCDKDMEPELTCTSVHFKKDWVTGESLFGELKGGYLFECSLGLARKLVEDDCFVLQCLGRHIPFELAVGANGRVWVNSAHTMHTVLISNAILNSEHMNDSMIQTLVNRLVQSVS